MRIAGREINVLISENPINKSTSAFRGRSVSKEIDKSIAI